MEVTRNGNTYDLQPVYDAIMWALSKSRAEDDANAYKNCDSVTRDSPLSLRLKAANSLLFKVRYDPAKDS